MNDEQLLIDEMNDFEDFMENADVEEIKKEHGLSSSDSLISPKFQEGVYSYFNITNILDYSITIYNPHRKSIDLPLYYNDDGYYFFLDSKYISRGSAFDDSSNNIYGVLLKEVNSWIVSDFPLYPVNGIEPYLDLYYKHNPVVEPLQVESQVKSFEVGKFYNYYIVSRTLKQIKIACNNDDNSCVGSHSVYKYKDSEFICSKVEYLSGLIYDDTYYHRIFYCGKIQRVIISTTDFFSTLSDDDLVSLYKSKFDFSILDNSSTEIVPTVPIEPIIQDETIIEVIESPEDIHKRICDNFDIVEKSLYEICIDLKTIRDNKYYKQLGYDTFEAYCLECFNMSRRNAYRFISVAENLSSDFVTTSSQIGLNKMYVLSRLTDDERTELLESTDIEHTPVKQVEQKAKEIKKNREVNSIWNGSSSSNVLDSKIKDDDNSSTYQSSSKEKEFIAKYGKEMNALLLVIRSNLKKLSKDFNIYSCHLDSCYSFLDYIDLSKSFGSNGLFSVDSFFKDVDFNKFINTVKALSMWVDNYQCISRGKCPSFDVNDIKDILCGLVDGDDKNGN